MNPEFPCTCGCPLSNHYSETDCCKDYYDYDEDYYGPCNCQMFTPDNLVFLEQEDERKTV